MTVRRKTLIIVGLTIIAMIAVIYGSLAYILEQGITRLESEEMSEGMNRLAALLQSDSAGVDRIGLDWSFRSDLKQMADMQDIQGLDSSLDPQTFEDLKINFIFLVNSSGNVSYAKIYPAAGSSTLNSLDNLRQALQKAGLFSPDGQQRMGLLSLPDGPAVLTRRFFKGDASQGAVILGRYMDISLLDHLAKETNLTTSFSSISDASRDLALAEILKQLLSKTPVVVRVVDAKTISGHILVNDITGKPVILLLASMSRPFYEPGQIILRYLLFGLALFGLVFFSLSGFLTNRLVLDRLARFSQQVTSVRETNQVGIRIHMDGNDELTRLSGQINSMLDELEGSYRQQLESEERYHILVQQALEGFALVDPESLRVVEGNQSFWNLIGIPAGQRDNYTLLEVNPIHGYYDSIRANHETFIREFRYTRLDGTSFEVEVSASGVTIQGQPMLFITLRDITERKQMQFELQHRLTETLLYNRVVGASTTALEPTSILETLCNEIAVTLGFPRALVGLWDENLHQLKIVAEYLSERRPSLVGEYIDLAGSDFVRDFIEQRVPLIVEQVEGDGRLPDFKAIFHRQNIASLLALPLITRSHVAGVLVLSSPVPRRFTDEEVALAQNVTSAASQALENLNLYIEVQQELGQRRKAEEALAKRERYLATLVELQQILISARNVEDTFCSLLELLGSTANASRAYICARTLATRQTCWLERPEYDWIPDDRGEREFCYSGRLAEWREALSAGQVISASTQEATDTERQVLIEFRTEAVLLLPLLIQGELYGVVGFDNCVEPRLWLESEITLLHSAARTISMALERQGAEEAFRQTALELQAVFNALPDMYIRLDSDGLILDYHLLHQEREGESLKIETGKDIQSVFPGEPGQLILDGVRQVHETADVVSLVYALPEQHALSYYDARLAPLANQQVVAIIRNISARVRTEQALRESERKYRQVVDGVHEVILQFDLAGRLVFLNKAWYEITGFTNNESLGAPFEIFVVSEDRHVIRDMFEALLGGNLDAFEDEIRCITKNGDQRWFEVFARLTLDDQQRRVGISGTLNDVTKRKFAENERRRSEESIRALYSITASQDMSSSYKVQALLIMGCEHFKLDTGILSRIEGQFYEVQEVYSTDHRVSQGVVYDLTQTFCELTLTSNGPVDIFHAGASSYSRHLCYQDLGIEAYLGTPVYVSGKPYGTLSFSSLHPKKEPFTSVEKEFLRLMSTWVGGEIERQQYIHQLHVSAEEIEKKNEALAEARDEALEAARLKSEFLATMSHEIRTPMNSVIGMTELMLETSLNNEQRDYISIVRESAHVLLSLINDILDFSKIEAGRMALEAIEFDPLEVVEGVVDLFASKSFEKGIELITFMAPEVPKRLVGDPTRLQQILINLIGNAVKFTRVGEVSLTITMMNESDSGIHLHFEVGDTGIGLSDAARRRLFQPFTQADGSTSRQYGGTGLGLAISKRLVELMGGSIGVDSVEGQGSTFWFTAQFERYSGLIPDGTASIRTDLIHNLRVLVVVASGTLRNMMGQYLQAWGIESEGVVTEQEAMALLQVAAEANHPFQVVIVDNHLKETRGLALAQKVKSVEMLADTRLVLLVDFDQRSQRDAALSRGFSEVVFKPIKQSLLFDAIANAVSAPVEPEFHSTPELVGTAKDVPGKVPGMVPAPAGRKGIILLAEDNPANQKLAIIQLQKLGYEAEVVENGLQAVNAVVESPDRYQLLLLDCQMPDMDGFEATRQIRKIEKIAGRHIPIVAMTANAMQGDRDACIAVGMDDYIGKPVILKNLETVLTRWVEGRGGAAVGEIQPVSGGFHVVPLDMEIFNGLRALQADGETDFVNDLIDMYLQDSRLMMDAIRRGAQNHDFVLLWQSAHRLKGNSSNLGALAIAAICNEVENRGKASDLTGMEDLLKRLDVEYVRTCSALIQEKSIH